MQPVEQKPRVSRTIVTCAFFLAKQTQRLGFLVTRVNLEGSGS